MFVKPMHGLLAFWHAGEAPSPLQHISSVTLAGSHARQNLPVPVPPSSIAQNSPYSHSCCSEHGRLAPSGHPSLDGSPASAGHLSHASGSISPSAFAGASAWHENVHTLQFGLSGLDAAQSALVAHCIGQPLLISNPYSSGHASHVPVIPSESLSTGGVATHLYSHSSNIPLQQSPATDAFIPSATQAQSPGHQACDSCPPPLTV